MICEPYGIRLTCPKTKKKLNFLLFYPLTRFFAVTLSPKNNIIINKVYDTVFPDSAKERDCN